MQYNFFRNKYCARTSRSYFIWIFLKYVRKWICITHSLYNYDQFWLKTHYKSNSKFLYAHSKIQSLDSLCIKNYAYRPILIRICISWSLQFTWKLLYYLVSLYTVITRILMSISRIYNKRITISREPIHTILSASVHEIRVILSSVLRYITWPMIFRHKVWEFQFFISNCMTELMFKSTSHTTRMNLYLIFQFYYIF